jgi:hypothetical protein
MPSVGSRSEWDYHGPGSQGYEANDINWMVKHAGA